jgi:pimeloyl-ACP methyl ester carboxylesterase
VRGTYAYERMRDDVRAFLAALGAERADLVGHSLGGAVACLLAQRDPAAVRRLVLEDVPAPTRDIWCMRRGRRSSAL